MFFNNPFKSRLPNADEALAGRATAVFAGGNHAVLGTALIGSVPKGMKQIVFGLGCFWGAERLFWTLPGVHVTAVGYAGGVTPNPTYEETCSGLTGHTEVVLLVYDPAKLALDLILTTFWQTHDPTQGFRQGNDRGTQYRSAIFVMDDDDLATVTASAKQYQKALAKAGFGQITTEIAVNDQFYYAEDYHQQYLHKVPNGYCGLQGTGVSTG
ncbi:peptide-methionine (S)-S-oxide reductase MsrA [bacterium]|jgi:peptide-methionine (S)-S-oxide reductase|nr:peptide-methionine (S)-S-oxide reductase MsrA [bacterium]